MLLPETKNSSIHTVPYTVLRYWDYFPQRKSQTPLVYDWFDLGSLLRFRFFLVLGLEYFVQSLLVASTITPRLECMDSILMQAWLSDVAMCHVSLSPCLP